MTRAFTHYWKNSTWERNDNLLGHTASNLFKKRGVEAGDSIFIVTVDAGMLYVGCVLQVDQVVGRRETQKLLGGKVWETSDHIIAKKNQPFYKNLRVPLDTVRALRFEGGKSLVFKEPGKLDQQTLRGVRELAPESADILRRILSSAPEKAIDGPSNSTAGSAEELKTIRGDPNAVRVLFDQFFDSIPTDTRRQWEGFLADAVDYAVAHCSSRWAMALHRNHLRFIVGMVLCIQFHPEWGATVLLDRKSAPKGLKVIRGKYRYAPGCDDIVVPFNKAPDVLDSIRAASRGAMDICAAAHGGTGTFRGAHSPGVLQYLESVLGRKLPNPSYSPDLANAAKAEITGPLNVDLLTDHPYAEELAREIEILANAEISPTEKEQLIVARRGQGVFRANVLQLEPRCRLTGVTDPNHLRASHIKPWKDSSNSERLSCNNGLMLAPHMDHLFDEGYISFTDVGDLLVSKECPLPVLAAWGVSPNMNVGPLRLAQRPFLAYHREHCFKHSSAT